MATSKTKNVGPSEEALGLDKGYIGPGNDGPADSEFSLESGPTSPSIVEQAAQAAAANADTLKAASEGKDTGAPPA